MKLAFLGLGGMGAPMAANLVQGGHEVSVWNRSPEAMKPLVEQGAKAAATPAEAAEPADVLFSMLADDDATRASVIDSGALAALRSGCIHICMATISVPLARELTTLHANNGAGYISAPVLGRTDVAAAGKLNILAGGAPELLDLVQPLLDLLGQKTWRFGDKPEQANAVKLAANFMIGSAIEAMSEASALAEGHGVATADFLDMIMNTLFAAPVYKGYGSLIAAKRFEPAGFKMVLGLKDIRIALEAAEAVRVPMPFASVVKDNLLDAIANGGGDLDWSALSEVASRRAGQKR